MVLNYNNTQMDYFYSCDLWIGNTEQKPSITITENNSETVYLKFDFSKDCDNEKE